MASSVIDGSVLEGGGQILRNAVSLSALLSRPVSIHSIRNNRTPPGLKSQHRTGLELAANIASARLTGAQNGSSQINFVPGRINLPDHFTADTVTAGSVALLLQIALPLLLFAPVPVSASTLTLCGGTNATMAPQVDYAKHVFLPFIERHFGIDKVSLDIRKRGYFPKGGGEIGLKVVPVVGDHKLHSFSLMHRGRVKRISGISHYASLPLAIGRGMMEGARKRLAQAGFGTVSAHAHDSTNSLGLNESLNYACEVNVSIDCRREPNALTRGPGSGIVLWAELEGGGMLGGSAVGTKGVSPERVGEEAADELIKGLNNGGCVDEWLQDQIVIFMALAQGNSEVNCGRSGLSLHTRTAIWVAEYLTDARFYVEENPAGEVIMRCQGIGYMASSSNAKMS